MKKKAFLTLIICVIIAEAFSQDGWNYVTSGYGVDFYWQCKNEAKNLNRSVIKVVNKNSYKVSVSLTPTFTVNTKIFNMGPQAVNIAAHSEQAGQWSGLVWRPDGGKTCPSYIKIDYTVTNAESKPKVENKTNVQPNVNSKNSQQINRSNSANTNKTTPTNSNTTSSTQTNSNQRNTQANKSNASVASTANAKQKELERQQQINRRQQQSNQQQEVEKQRQRIERKKQISKENYENQINTSNQIENARINAYNSIENAVYGTPEQRQARYRERREKRLREEEETEYRPKVVVTAEEISDRHNITGMKYSARKEYKDAIIQYDYSIQRNSSNYKAYYNRGLAYIYLEEYDKAILDFSNCINYKPNMHEAFCYRGLAYINLKQYDKGVEDCYKAYSLNSNYLLSYKILGISFFMQESFPEAYELLLKALPYCELDEEENDIFYYLGYSAYFMQQYSKSIKYFNKFLKNEIYFDLSGKTKENKLYMSRLRQEIIAVYLRGRAKLTSRKFRSAIKDFTQIINRFNVLQSTSYSCRGDAYRMIKKYDLSIADYKKALEIDDKNLGAALGLIMTYYSLKDEKNYKNYLSVAVKITPELKLGYSHIEAMIKNEGWRFFDEEIEILKAVLNCNPNPDAF
jgi:tetratricopeptide (TPR) repeat protein